MRTWTIVLTSALAIGCAPVHPTHPTQVNCIYGVETLYSARVDTSIPDPNRQLGDDPCFNGTALLQTWSEPGVGAASICMAAGTTEAQAATACTAHLDSLGLAVGSPAIGAPPLFGPPIGHVCGVADILQAVVTSRSFSPTLQPEACRADTTLPLR